MQFDQGRHMFDLGDHRVGHPAVHRGNRCYSIIPGGGSGGNVATQREAQKSDMARAFRACEHRRHD